MNAPASQKIIYIAHPIGGDVEGNLKKIAQIAREISLAGPDDQGMINIPIAPYFLDLQALRDDSTHERNIGMRNNRALFYKGAIDEVWLYGDRISNGMLDEIRLARLLRIPVIPKTQETMHGILDYITREIHAGRVALI